MGALSQKHQNGSLSLSTPKILALRLIELTCSVCIPRPAFGRRSVRFRWTSLCLFMYVSMNQCRPSPYQLFNLRSYSTSEETRSEHWVATPILPAPVNSGGVLSLNCLPNLTQDWLPTTFTRHSEISLVKIIFTNYLLSSIIVNCDWATRTTNLVL